MSTREPEGDVRPRPLTRLLPTLLDRLLDDAPGEQTEAPEDYAVSPRRMREIVQRDLSWLLNTTSLEDEIDRKAMPLAALSVINYGVPPLAGSYLSQRQWAEIELVVRRAITEFEPRILPETLAVVPLEDPRGDPHYNVVQFEIRGMVHMQPYPTEFMVRSSLDLESRRVVFK